MPTPVVPLELLPLRTQGRWILDNRSQRFRLKCVNWYGASGELYVVHGLHKRTMQDVVSKVVEWGFNCVRLPFSLELFFTNPLVPAHALRADPLGARGNLTGLEAYDAAVAAITGAGLLVVVDNHSTDAQWCCMADAPDGVWFTDHYPESRWIEALANMTRRFRSNPRVVAIELRNEVRDAGVNQVVWGTGDLADGKVAADWPSAAERAGNAVLAANPSVLVLVTGLCYGQDLRGAAERPVQLSVPGRLVWTTHSYHWYFWWHSSAIEGKGSVIGGVTLALSLVFVLLLALLLVKGPRPVTTVQAVFEVSTGFVSFLGLFLVAYSLGVRHGYGSTACVDSGQREVAPALTTGSVLLTCGLCGAVLAALLRWRRRRHRLRAQADKDLAGASTGGSGGSTACSRVFRRCSAHCLPLLVWLALSCGALAVFGFSMSSYWLVAQQIDRHWGFVMEEGQAYTAPVVLGEFGTAHDGDFWQALMQYVGEKDVDFAYWPLNGQKWNHDQDHFVQEYYGLLDKSWSSVRHDWKLRDVIGYDASASGR